jgi:hypothetical protein
MARNLGWAFGGAMALLAILALARAATAGPLDPPGPVGSTMRTLDELLPSWGKSLSATGGCTSERFTCVFGDTAVLDHETGLVWQRNPVNSGSTWTIAFFICDTLEYGGRQGWRLPSVQEQRSLLASGANLPPGHPFEGLLTDKSYWSGTTEPSPGTFAYAVQFGNNTDSQLKTDNNYVWCVRGGSSIERP